MRYCQRIVAVLYTLVVEERQQSKTRPKSDTFQPLFSDFSLAAGFQALGKGILPREFY
jgi:hypothetical protein